MDQEHASRHDGHLAADTSGLERPHALAREIA